MWTLLCACVCVCVVMHVRVAVTILCFNLYTRDFYPRPLVLEIWEYSICDTIEPTWITISNISDGTTFGK